jgi:hypothetical protein
MFKVEVGDVVVVSEAVAGMLIREGWAEPARGGVSKTRA